MYTENHKMCLKEVKVEENKWKNTCVHELEDLLL